MALILKVNFCMPLYTVYWCWNATFIAQQSSGVLKVGIVCLCVFKEPIIQPRIWDFLIIILLKLIYNGPNSQQAKYSGVVSKLVTCKLLYNDVMY